MMKFRRDQRGFIFSLDAALALLVVLIVMAGVARVGSPGSVYGQHGYLRLEQYANDALEVMELTGTLDSVINYVKHENYENAENIIRTELEKILPSEVQYRLVIGDNRLTVYPSDAAGWESAFSDAEEIAVGTRMSTFPENLKILAWLDDDLDREFMDNLQECTNWNVTSTDDLDVFWTEVLQHLAFAECYDVIFIPDAETDLETGYPLYNYYLWDFAHYAHLYDWGGRLVVGGKTLYYNYDDWNSDQYLWEILGAQWTWNWWTWSGVRPSQMSGYENMTIIDTDYTVTAPYYISENIGYRENYEQYDYDARNNAYVHTLAQWEETGSPWPGIILRENGYESTSHPGWYFDEPAVLFNMRFSQSAMDPDQPEGTEDWINLVRRAIGYEQKFEPITLYVWRGEEVT